MLATRGVEPEHLQFQLGFQDRRGDAAPERRGRGARGPEPLAASAAPPSLVRSLSAHGVDTYA